MTTQELVHVQVGQCHLQRTNSSKGGTSGGNLQSSHIGSPHWSGAILAQVGIQAPGLSFRCICHLGNPIKTRFESGFCLLCTSHGPCCMSPCHQVWEICVGTQYAHVGYSGVELVSRATYISRKKRNLETVQRHSKALKKAQRNAKRKFIAQQEISHEAAELILRNQAPRTYEKFPGTIHVSHHLALLHGHENVFFCTQCGAVNAWWSFEATEVSVRRIWRIPSESETQA